MSSQSSQCPYCASGFHLLCLNLLTNSDVVCCCTKLQSDTSLNFVQEQKDVTVIQAKKRGRPEKEIGEFEDQLSSGRKRAAKLFPIETGQLCEWAWRKFCGGGIVPVTGCSGRIAKHIHHGPDKSVLNNDRETNISIICTFCHQLWHARNDKYYEGERPEDGSAWLPTTKGIQVIHELNDLKPATAKEIAEFEVSIDREMTVEDWTRIRERTATESIASTPQ